MTFKVGDTLRIHEDRLETVKILAIYKVDALEAYGESGIIVQYRAELGWKGWFLPNPPRAMAMERFAKRIAKPRQSLEWSIQSPVIAPQTAHPGDTLQLTRNPTYPITLNAAQQAWQYQGQAATGLGATMGYQPATATDTASE